MRRHIAKQIVDIHVFFQRRALGNMLQRRHHPLMILFPAGSNFALPDGGIAVQLVVDIIQVSAAAAKAAEAPKAASSGEAVSILRLSLRFLGKGRKLAGIKALGHLRRAAEGRKAAGRRVIRSLAPGGERAEISLGHLGHIALGRLFFFPASYIHAVRLVKLAPLRAVIAQQEAVLHRLQRQVYAPVFPVDGNFRIVIQRRIRPQKTEHIVNQRLLHIGGVGVIIIENQLIQPVAGLPLHIMIEFQLQAVAIGGGIAGDGGEAGISLGAHAHVIEGFPVDLHIAGIISLLRGGGQHFLPFRRIHEDIDLQRLGGIE